MKPFSMMMVGKPTSKAAPFDFSFFRSCVLSFFRFFVLAFLRSCNVIALVC